MNNKPRVNLNRFSTMQPKNIDDIKPGNSSHQEVMTKENLVNQTFDKIDKQDMIDTDRKITGK